MQKYAGGEPGVTKFIDLPTQELRKKFFFMKGVIKNMNKRVLLEKAIEITKEYAKGGGNTPLDTILEQVYEKLKKLNVEVEAENG